MFGSQISQKTLALVSRSLSTLLESGVDVRKAFELAATKTSEPRCREAMADITTRIAQGDGVAAAIRAQGRRFPDLFVDMVEMAEQTGALPEVLKHLADHYDKSGQLRKTFLMAIAWPAFQLVAAILVIAALILILGMIAGARGGEPLDVLGLGLTGFSGAVIWSVSSFGSIAALLAGYYITTKTLAGKRLLDPLLMKIPVVGRCMRSFAIARFSWAFYLTQQTGMPVAESLDTSLRATANGKFIAASPRMCQTIQEGADLSSALAQARLFPDDFLHMVTVAETSGTVPEQLFRLSPQFDEQARRSLHALTVTLSCVVWLVVAAFVIALIFRLVFWYLGMIDEALQGT